MANKTVHLRWYTDPGHGWIRVSRKDCERLGILDQISSYSYQSKMGNTLYLEEDCDAQILLKALHESKEYLPCYSIDKHVNQPTRIRSLDRYQRIFTDVICNRWEPLLTLLDKLEAYCSKLWKHYSIPRPDNDHPWNYELYCEVLENAEEWIKEHTGLSVYWDTKGNLVATNDVKRANRDLLAVFNRIKLSQENRK